MQTSGPALMKVLNLCFPRREIDQIGKIQFIENVDAIKQLKNSEGLDLQVWGSSKLIHLLLQHDLVDELRIKTYPVILGGGKKLFDSGEMPASFKLTESVVTTTGVIIAAYKREGDVKTGTAGE